MQPTAADFAALRQRLDRVQRAGIALTTHQTDRYAEQARATVRQLFADERAAQAQRDREAQRRAQLDTLRGGPCVYCGQTVSGVRQDYSGEHGSAAVRSELRPHWTSTPLGPSCYECSQDVWAAGGAHFHKGHVARALLEQAGKAGHWTPAALGDVLRRAHTPVYWSEHTPRPATRDTEAPLTDRFAFVSTEAILAALPKPPPPPSFTTGRPCATCGSSDRWVHIPASTAQLRSPQVSLTLDTDLTAPLSGTPVPSGLADIPVSAAWRCWACGEYGRP